MQISLVIPALNEAECLAALLTEITFETLHQVIVVDNGSTDATASVASQNRAEVVSEPRQGYGYACAAGAAAADGEVLVFMDGDGSFTPVELTLLVAPLVKEGAELVLGARRLDAPSTAMPPHQRLGNRLFTWLLRQRFGLRLTDLGPYRAIRHDLLRTLDMQERTYGWPLEMIVKAARAGCHIVEIPVTYHPRLAGKSKVSGTLRGTLLTAYRFSRVVIRYAY